MNEIDLVPHSVRQSVEFHLNKVLEVGDWLKSYWWSQRYRSETLENLGDQLREARAFLHEFKELAAANGLNGTAILRTILGELRAGRPAVKVLSRSQVSRLVGG